MSEAAEVPSLGRPTAAVLLFLPLLLTWPLALHPISRVMAAPDQEAATHIWGLWAAGQTLSPLRIETSLQGFPDGVGLVLVDPVNLLPFHLAAGLGPAAAYNAVLWWGLLTMGLAGALLSRELGGRPWLGAVAAMACPTLLANAADGMTEGFSVGIVGLFLALTLAALRRPGAGRILLAGLSLGATAWAGPYNAIWAAWVGLGLAVLLLLQRRFRDVKITVGIGLVGLVAAMPVARAIFQHRDEGLPGGSHRAGMPGITENPEIFRGGVQTGADLLDPLLPVQLTGGEADVSHTAYLGIVMFAVALRVALAHRRARAFVAAALAFSLLSMGPWLYFGGEVLTLAQRPLAGPAGLVTLAIPLFGRLTRWYRAGAVATLLLAPVVSLAPRRRFGAILLATALLADVLLLAPLAWPLHSSPLPDTASLHALPEPGALLELPPVTSGPPPPGGWRDLSALAQVLHNRPIGGSMMGLGVSPAARSGVEAVRELVRSGNLDPTMQERVRAEGFRYLVIHLPHHPIPANGREHLTACLGLPVVDTEHVRVHDLGMPGSPAGCSVLNSSASGL